jgi:hypothetical protein
MDLLVTVKKRPNPSRYVAFIAGHPIARAPTLSEAVNLARYHIATCYTAKGIPVNVKIITPSRRINYTVSPLGIIRYQHPKA